MFQFSTQSDAEVFRTLSYLAKSNNGQFKSVKQAQFLTKQYKRSFAEIQHTVDSVKKHFNIDITDTQYTVSVDAWMQWAGYGVRGNRPIMWIFVMDDQGVVAQYKLGFVGDMRKGCGVDPQKTTKLWERVGEVTPLVMPVVEQAPESNFVGNPGERLEIVGTIKAVFEFNKTRRFSYYDSGIGYVTKVDVNGNDVVYFGKLGEKGDHVAVKATIKDHSVRDGRKQTIISRPRAI
jgi:hypothetical protein